MGVANNRDEIAPGRKSIYIAIAFEEDEDEEERYSLGARILKPTTR